MLKDDRMISILSGVVLMLALGVIAQRVDLAEGLFGPDPERVVLRDDIAVIEAGELVRIEVLGNDSGLKDGAGSRLGVVEMPDCGQVYVQDGALQFFGGLECLGKQRVAYVLDDETAEVTVVVRRTAATARTMAAPDPATGDPAGEGTTPADGEPGSGAPGDDAPVTAPVPAPVEAALAPDPVTAPPEPPTPAVMPDALRRAGEGSAPAPVLAGSGPPAPDAARGGPGRPIAPERVPVPLIGVDSAAAADLPPDYDADRAAAGLPGSGLAPVDVVAPDLPAELGGSGMTRDAPGEVGPLAALGPADSAPPRPVDADPLGDTEPAAMRLAPLALALPGPVAGHAVPASGAGSLPVLTLPSPAVSPDEISLGFLPGHPASGPAVGPAEPAWPAAPPGTLPRIAALSVAPSGAGGPLPGLSGPDRGPAPVAVPGREGEPLGSATEPRPQPPVRLVAAGPSETAGAVPAALSAGPGVAEPGAPAGVPGVTPVLIPAPDAPPLADASEPRPAAPARLASADPGESGGPFVPGDVPAPRDRAVPAAAAPPPEISPAGEPHRPELETAALGPAGETCTDAPQLRATEHPAAMTGLEISAPCLAGTVVRVVHEGLVLGTVLSDEGRGSLVIPGLRPASMATVFLADGKELPIELRFRDTERLQRLIVAWDAPVEFALHAFSGTARSPGEPGHVGPAHPRSSQEARLRGGGFLTTVPAAGQGSQRLEVYTLWQNRRSAAGVVRMELDFVSRREAGGDAACGASPDASPEYVLLVSVGGEVEPLTRSRIAALDCAAVPSQGDGFVDGALPNLVISAR